MSNSSLNFWVILQVCIHHALIRFHSLFQVPTVAPSLTDALFIKSGIDLCRGIESPGKVLRAILNLNKYDLCDRWYTLEGKKSWLGGAIVIINAQSSIS